MATYQKCDKAVYDLAQQILAEFGTHTPVLEANVKIDLVFAFKTGDTSDACALKCHGARALGITRRISLKDRAQGRGDVEIALDGDWWMKTTVANRRALLDHELHHIQPDEDLRGFVLDDLNRPKITLRKHDFQFGWFNIIAERHGEASIERQQAAEILLTGGQYYWPEIDRASKPIVQVEAESTGTMESETDEELLSHCIEVLRQTNRASVSVLQRRLRIGYTRAARMLEILEERGIVGPNKGSEPREILASLPAN